MIFSTDEQNLVRFSLIVTCYLPAEAALLLNASSWSGRRYKLTPELLRKWSAKHELQSPADDAPNASSETLCRSLGLCVCDGDSTAYLAYQFHLNFVALLKPFVRNPRQVKGQARQPSPEGRVLLEGTWLVCRLIPSTMQGEAPHESGADSDVQDAPAASSSAGGWALAVRNLLNKRQVAPLRDVFFLINYVNFQSYRFTAMLLECEADTSLLSADSESVLPTRIPDGLEVRRSVQFFEAHLDLDVPWTCAWYRIVGGAMDEDSLVDPDEMKPDSFMAEPTSAVGQFRPWKGRHEEARDRAAKTSSRKRKRQPPRNVQQRRNVQRRRALPRIRRQPRRRDETDAEADDLTDEQDDGDDAAEPGSGYEEDSTGQADEAAGNSQQHNNDDRGHLEAAGVWDSQESHGQGDGEAVPARRSWMAREARVFWAWHFLATVVFCRWVLFSGS